MLAYLLMMTRSMTLNRIEQRRNRWQLVQRWSHQLFPSAVRGPQEAAEAGHLSQRVCLAHQAIPANQRQVLKMACYEDLRQSAIADPRCHEPPRNPPPGNRTGSRSRSRPAAAHSPPPAVSFRSRPWGARGVPPARCW